MNNEQKVLVKVIMRSVNGIEFPYYFTVDKMKSKNDFWAITTHVLFAEAVPLAAITAIEAYFKDNAPRSFVRVETVPCVKTYSTFLHQFIARAS